MSPPMLVAMRGISKAFGAIVALRQVDFDIAAGEVVGLVGDNAAGKSTLMKVLAGTLQPDAGTLLVAGQPVKFESPMASRAAGIEMVYQDFALVPELTVTQNIFLGRELVRRVCGVEMLHHRRMAARAIALIDGLGLRVPPVATEVRALSGGQQQAVAIARAAAFDARLVILDEPTANLGQTAIEKVRALIGGLKRAGVAVILISHRLEDVFAAADRVVVMKHGHVVGTRRTAETENDEVLQMIITGRDPRTHARPQIAS